MFKRFFQKPRSPSNPCVIIHIFETQIDLFPIAEEVIELAPEPCGMDPFRLATLAHDSFYGTYIKVAEYPDGVDREYAKLIIRRVVQWASWQHREPQFSDFKAKNFTFHVEKDACPKMLELAGKSCAKTGFQRLPLDDCWQKCFCRHRMSKNSKHS